MHAHTPMLVPKVIPTKHTLKITVWLTKQEVGKPTQSDRCHGNGQWEQGVNEGVSSLSSQVGLSVILSVGMNSKNVGRTAVDGLSRLNRGKKRRRMWAGKEEEKKKKKRGRSKGGELRLESTWSVSQGRKRRRRAVRSCNNTVWQSEGELLDLQRTVYTQTHTYTPNVHARLYTLKTFSHPPRLTCVILCVCPSENTYIISSCLLSFSTMQEIRLYMSL